MTQTETVPSAVDSAPPATDTGTPTTAPPATDTATPATSAPVDTSVVTQTQTVTVALPRERNQNFPRYPGQ